VRELEACRWAWMGLVLLAGCATGGVGQGVPGQYAQSMDSATSACLRNPACYTQAGDEAVIPWATRAVQAVRTTATVMELLSDADVRLVEKILVECVKNADFEVDEREFGEGKGPTDEQCNEVVRREGNQDVTRAMDLGTKKHVEALKCIESRLEGRLLRHVTREPRYKYDPASKRWRMLDPEVVARWVKDKLFDLLKGTLVPDFVIHEAGNPNRVQRIYDFKFPCLSKKRGNPDWRKYPGATSQQPRDQAEKYRRAFGSEARPTLISPQFGLQ
jgi:hypothetical protein